MGLPKQPEGICQLWNVCNVFLGVGQTTVNYPVSSPDITMLRHAITGGLPITPAQKQVFYCNRPENLGIRVNIHSSVVPSKKICLPEFCLCVRLQVSPPSWTGRPLLHLFLVRWSGPVVHLTWSVCKCGTAKKKKKTERKFFKTLNRPS